VKTDLREASRFVLWNTVVPISANYSQICVSVFFPHNTVSRFIVILRISIGNFSKNIYHLFTHFCLQYNTNRSQSLLYFEISLKSHLIATCFGLNKAIFRQLFTSWNCRIAPVRMSLTNWSLYAVCFLILRIYVHFRLPGAKSHVIKTSCFVSFELLM
jgi:hypothetical protein